MEKFNVISIWVAKLVVLFFPLLITPIILNRYGLEGAAVFVLANQISSYINMFDFGVTNGVARYIRKFRANHEAGPAPIEYIATCFAGLGIVAVLILLFLGMVFLLADVYPILSFKDNDFFHSCLIAGVMTALTFPLRIGGAYFIGYNKHYLAKNIETIFIILKIALVFIFINYLNVSLEVIITIIFVISFLIVITHFDLARRYDPDFKIQWVNVKWQHYRKIISLSSASAYISLSSLAVFHMPVTIFAARVNLTDEIIFLAYPIMIMLTASQFYSAYQSTLTPIATKYSLSNDWLKLRSVLILSVKKYYATSLIGVSIFTLIGDLLLRSWLPENITDHQVRRIFETTIIFLVLQSFYGAGYLMASILIGAGDLKKYASFEIVITFFATLVYLSYAYFFVPAVGGFAFAMVFVLIAKYFLALPIFLKRTYAISVIDYLQICLCINKSVKITNGLGKRG